MTLAPTPEVMYNNSIGRLAELVDALDSKSCGSNTVRVQVPRRPPN